MADILNFYVGDDRSIKYTITDPIMQEDNGVAVWRFRIPKVLNNIDMSGFAWWFVYINAAKQKYSEPLTLTADADDPDNYCIADYTIDYGISLTPGSFTFALEAINANGNGDIVEEWHTKTYSHSVIGTLQGNQAEYSETESDIISALMVQIQEKYNALVGGATPIPVASISAMTDTSKIYLLTTDNNWYCYNGSTWVSGGQYASGIVIDPTLTQSGQAADAAVVGEELTDLKSDFIGITDPNRLVETTASMVSDSLYISGASATIQSSSVVRSLIVPCDSGKYLITKMQSPTFRIGYCKVQPAANKAVYGKQDLSTATNAVIEITEDDVYLVITYYVNNNGYDYDEILASIKICNDDFGAKDTYARNIMASKSDIIEIEDCFPDEAYSRATYNPSWKQGNVDGSGTFTESLGRIRTDYIPVGIGVLGALSSGSDQKYWVRVFNSDKTFIGTGYVNSDGSITTGNASTSATTNPIDVDTVKNSFPTASYIICAVRNNADTNLSPSEAQLEFTERRGAFDGISLDNIYERKAKLPYSASDLSFFYDVKNGYQTKGFLKLPPNYVSVGEKVPLVVFVHGSDDIGSINASVMTNSYNAYYNYIRDCGYAVFDCYPLSSKYSSQGANTWGIPLNDACYLSGIKYVCDNYNVDADNVFVSCKSLGGLQALKMLLSDAFNIKAVGMLAPELWYLNMQFGYNYAMRNIIAAELGFSEDTGDVMNYTNGTDPIPNGFYDYVTENMAKWNGVFSNFIGLPILPTNKPNYYTYTQARDTKSMFRTSMNRPLKVWIASDDSAVDYRTASAVVDSLANNGCHAELRTMPSGTGGHHSVDNAENAPQTTNVTTPLGIEYASIPTAYYELVEFFNQFVFK